MSTPVTDMIRDLVSQGVSWDVALNAATKIEAKFAENATARGSSEEKRRYERDRKADYRARIAAASPGTSRSDIYTSESPRSQNQVKKDIPNVPASPGRRRDDWPSDHLEIFWNAYPSQRRTEKAKVDRKLNLIRKSGKVTWAKLIAGVERYARSGDVARGFAKGPMPWLNGGCWDDETKDVQQPAKASAQRPASLLSRIATEGLRRGEDQNAKEPAYDGPTLDLRALPNSE